MNAFHFGASAAPLFGAWDAPARASRRGVVLCAPWGQEYLRSHKACRRLAALLADAGLHVLRFDYHATGDSAGESAAADPRRFVQDVRTAVEELRDVAGVSRVSLVGVRLGALVALRAAPRLAGLERVVLWDPVLDGTAHRAELLTGYGRHAPLAPGTDGVVEALGFPLGPGFLAGCAALDAPPLADEVRVPVHVVASRDDAAARGFAAALGARGLACPVDVVEGAPAWIEERDFGTGAVPAALLQRIVGVLS